MRRLVHRLTHLLNTKTEKKTRIFERRPPITSCPCLLFMFTTLLGKTLLVIVYIYSKNKNRIIDKRYMWPKKTLAYFIVRTDQWIFNKFYMLSGLFLDQKLIFLS